MKKNHRHLPLALAAGAALLFSACRPVGPGVEFLVLSVSPSSGATNVALDAEVSVVFNREVNESTLDDGSFIVEAEGAELAGSLSYSNRTATFRPAEPLSHSTTYTARVTTGIFDLEGNTLPQQYGWSFTTVSSMVSDEPDAEGNLLVVNSLEESLYLYNGEEVLKRVPAGATNFLVMVDNNGFAQTLRMWRVADVSDPQAPDGDDLFKRWDLVLDQTPIPQSECPLWVIREGGGGTASGTLSFSYPATGQDGLPVLYSVDIYLNAKTGAKITSIAPGMSGKKIGIEYNYYVVYYRYWYDDPNDLDPAYEIKWLPEDGDPPIQTLINLANDTKNLDVPVYYGASDGRTGEITITNNTSEYVKIYANNTQIEELHITTEPTAGLSILEPDGGSFTFLIPEATYNLQARSLVSNSTLASQDSVEVIEAYDYSWNVETGATYAGIMVTNDTEFTLTVHDDSTGGYLGYRLEPGESLEVEYGETVTGLRVYDRWRSYGNVLGTIGSSWTVDDLILMDMTPPGPVTTVSIYEQVGALELSWTNPSDADLDGVLILRKDTGFPATPTDGTEVYSGTGESYADVGLVSGNTHYYTIWTYDLIPNYSAVGVEISGTTAVPGEVTDLATVVGDGSVDLSWRNPVGSWLEGVVVIKNESHAPASPTDGIEVFDGIGESCTDLAVVNGNTYYYAVFTYDGTPNYSAGAQISAVPSQDTDPPGTVTGLTASTGDGYVDLSWTNPTDADLAGVLVLRKTGSYPTSYADGSATEAFDGFGTSVNDTGLTNGVTYYYSLFSYDQHGNYSESADVSARPASYEPGSETFSFTGAVQSFTVPQGVPEVTIEVWGAQGGGSQGGKGGYATGELSVSGGDTLYVYVGGAGVSEGNGGFNGGGDASTYASSGGGASDVRYGGTTLANRVIVGGGGGGGTHGSLPAAGGAGGGLTGFDGQDMSSYIGGGGGTQTSGGAAGSGYSGSEGGGLGYGGGSGSYHNAGGGGGYYGGGSGSAYAGAGGGSSYVGGVQNGTTSADMRVGNGAVTISWD